MLKLQELAYDIFVHRFRPKTSSFQLPYQRHSSSADGARELFKGLNELTTHKKSAPPTKKFFFECKLQDLQSLLSFWPRSVVLTGLEKFLLKTTCVSVFFSRKSLKATGCQSVNNFAVCSFWVKSWFLMCLSKVITCQAIMLESYSNLQKTLARFWVCTEKIFFGFGFSIFCGWRHKRNRFLVILVHVTWPRAPTTKGNFWLS